MSRIVHRYRINEEDKSDYKMVAGIELSKQWKDFNSEKQELTSFIKSVANQSGFLDYQKKDLVSQEVIYKSVAKEKQIPIYSKQALHLMSRNEIVEIFKMYGIDTTNKTKDFLIVELLKIQPEEEIIQEDVTDESIEENETLMDIAKEINTSNEVSTETVLDRIRNKIAGSKNNG